MNVRMVRLEEGTASGDGVTLAVERDGWLSTSGGAMARAGGEQPDEFEPG